MDKFDPNHILTNINKLKPYKFLDDETKTIDGPQVVYWEGQGDVDVNDKKKQQWKTSLCGIEWVDRRRIQDESGHIIVKVDVDDICLEPTLNGNRRHNISNNETLKGIMTN